MARVVDGSLRTLVEHRGKLFIKDVGLCCTVRMGDAGICLKGSPTMVFILLTFN